MKTQARLDPRIEECRTLNDMIVEVMESMPSITTQPAAVTRKAREEGKSAFPIPERLDDIATVRTIAGRSGDVGLRVFTPSEVTGVVLHLHGGGWTFGANWMQDVLLWDMAQAAKVAVASVEYRLAPEHPSFV